MYEKLKTKKIRLGESKKRVTMKILKDALKTCYTESAFSTFPYIDGNMSSKDALKKYNSGCCIALCLFIKQHLKGIGIHSQLVPASIPDKYKMEGFLHIAHVALVVVVNEKKVYLMDPAFYFIVPVSIALQVNKIAKVMSKNIYEKENETELCKYTSITDVICRTMMTQHRVHFNDYQSIPRHTFYIKCHHVDDVDDTWEYYIREVINPDEAICKFFIGTRNIPFITVTDVDNNDIVRSKGFLLVDKNKGIIQFGRGDEKKEVFNKTQLSRKQKREITKLFKINISDYI
jgi:hypothetical protein